MAVAALVAGACTRSTGLSTATARPVDIYAAGPSVADVRGLLGDANWWPGTPTFVVRPLNASTLPFTERFAVTQRFLHIGTAEHFLVEYTVWDSSSTATTEMSNIQSALGTSPTNPKAGDQVLYYAQQQSSGASLYVFLIFVRVGAVVISAEWSRADAHPGLDLLGKIANKLANRLKDVLAGRIHASPVPASDSAYLPPLGNDVTLLGAARMPIQAVVELLPGAPPDQLVASFTDGGVKDFLYGDYALDNDSRMEVRAAEFEFSGEQAATDWIDQAVGADNLNANGVAAGYSDSGGLYYAFFTVGSHGAMLFCGSTAQGEAASRACETPVESVISAWQVSLANL
jgi:hypothetical protein